MVCSLIHQITKVFSGVWEIVCCSEIQFRKHRRWIVALMPNAEDRRLVDALGQYERKAQTPKEMISFWPSFFKQRCTLDRREGEKGENQEKDAYQTRTDFARPLISISLFVIRHPEYPLFSRIFAIWCPYPNSSQPVKMHGSLAKKTLRKITEGYPVPYSLSRRPVPPTNHVKERTVTMHMPNMNLRVCRSMSERAPLQTAHFHSILPISLTSIRADEGACSLSLPTYG